VDLFRPQCLHLRHVELFPGVVLDQTDALQYLRQK
jgi:hypothetical protein